MLTVLFKAFLKAIKGELQGSSVLIRTESMQPAEIANSIIMTSQGRQAAPLNILVEKTGYKPS